MNRALGSRYHLGDLLGRGATGQVYAGVDDQGNAFAFKVLRSDLTDDPELVARFIQEKSILLSLRHPNLVAVHDLVVEGDTVAIVMDRVPGGDLRAYLKEYGALLPAEVARIGSRIASGLAEVHARGVVHRDVKPENILMDSSGTRREPRLTDFGISRLIGSTRLGRSSVLAGTPQYVAPELAAGEDATPAADLYSLGIVLYELSCGVTPFVGRSMLETVRQHAELEPGRPEDIAEPLWEMISWLLRKGPRSRPQSAHGVATVLEAMVEELGLTPAARRLDAPPPGVPIGHNQVTQSGPRLPAPASPALPGWPMATPPPGPGPKRRRRSGRILTAVVLLVLAGGGIWLVGNAHSSSPIPLPIPNPSASTTAAAPTTAEPPQLVNAPNLIGRKLSDAQDSLPSSIKVTTVDTVSQEAPDGTVIDQDPKPNAPIDGTIELTVARQPVEVYLDSLDPVQGRWDSGATTQLGGQTLPHAVGLGLCYSSEAVEYNVSKGFRRLVATAGVDDNSGDSTTKAQLEIFADGRRVASTPIDYGKPSPVDVDLSGVLRLKIQWTLIVGECSGHGIYLTLGDAKLLGLPGEVPQPSTTPTN